MKLLSCGTLITDGSLLLIVHPTYSNVWDIPKGKIEPGESPLEAAVRECKEETGYNLQYHVKNMVDYGPFPYLKKKDLHVFGLKVSTQDLPNISNMKCEVMIEKKDHMVFETDRFIYAPITELDKYLIPNMLEIVTTVLKKINDEPDPRSECAPIPEPY